MVGSAREGETPASSGVAPSARNRHQAVPAIIAPLSVHNAGGGRNARRPDARAASATRDRSLELAATPPPSTRVGAPASSAAATSLVVSTSTTASWNEAATSLVATSGCLRTWFTTAVLSPEKEKS